MLYLYFLIIRFSVEYKSEKTLNLFVILAQPFAMDLYSAKWKRFGFRMVISFFLKKPPRWVVFLCSLTDFIINCEVRYEKENGSCHLGNHTLSPKVGGLVWLIFHLFFFLLLLVAIEKQQNKNYWGCNRVIRKPGQTGICLQVISSCGYKGINDSVLALGVIISGLAGQGI